MSKQAGQERRLDARSLRALAHPLRMRILNILAAEGPATSTTLAGRLGENTGTLSWHLRHLAQHGLIEEEPDRGTKRERWWRTPAGSMTTSAPDLASGTGEGAATMVVQETASFHFDLVARHWARVVAGGLGSDWVEASAMLGSSVHRMSPGELKALNRELVEVIKRHSQAAEEAAEPDGERVVVLLHSFPVPPDPAGAAAPPTSPSS